MFPKITAIKEIKQPDPGFGFKKVFEYKSLLSSDEIKELYTKVVSEGEKARYFIESIDSIYSEIGQLLELEERGNCEDFIKMCDNPRLQLFISLSWFIDKILKLIETPVANPLKPYVAYADERINYSKEVIRRAKFELDIARAKRILNDISNN